MRICYHPKNDNYIRYECSSCCLIKPNGASHLILKQILDEKLTIALTTPVVLEYDDVLKRKEMLENLKLSREQVEDVIDLLVLLADKYSVYYRLRPNLLDENDNLFIECAFTSNSQYLVTSNIKDFTKGELKSYPFEVITLGIFITFGGIKNE